MNLKEQLQKQPQWMLVCEALVLILIIGFFDYITGHEISLFILYSVPILLLVWFSDKKTAILIAIVCGITWYVAEMGTGYAYSHSWIAAWNAVVRLIVFLFVAAAGFALKIQLDQSQEKIKNLEKFHVLAEISPFGIFHTDEKGRYLYVNERWCQILGINQHRALGELWTTALVTDDQNRFIDEWLTAKSSDAPFEFELRFQNIDGKVRWLFGQVAPEKDMSAKTIGYVGAVGDLTEQKRMEHEILGISEREQQRISQDVHDGLCQYLTAIGFAVSTLVSDLEAKLLDEAKAAREIGGLLKDAVGQARNIARGIFPVKLEEEGLQSALHEFVSMTSRLVNISCTFEYYEPIPIYDRNCALHLYRIAQESVNNAIKHGRAQNIVISLTSEKDQIILTIQDDGIGFPEIMQTHNGMGLHIMNYRARMIGASIVIKKIKEGGTLVTCSLRQHENENSITKN